MLPRAEATRGSARAVHDRRAAERRVTPHAERSRADDVARPRRARIEEALLPPLVALLVAAVVGDLLILIFGQSPGAVYRLLLEGTWGNAYGFGQVLYKATTLTFTGLAVALGLRAGLFNIGAESQLAAGGFCAALVGLLLPAGHAGAARAAALHPRRGARRRRRRRGARRAQGAVRRARSDRDDHAQLHRARAAQLHRRRRSCTCPRRCTRRRSGRGALPRLVGLSSRRSTARRRTSTILLAIARRGRALVVSCSARGAASSCARSGCSPTPRSTAA